MAEIIAAAVHQSHAAHWLEAVQVRILQTVQDHIIGMGCIPSIQVRGAYIIFALIFEHTIAFTPCALVNLMGWGKADLAVFLCNNLREENPSPAGAIRIHKVAGSIIIGEYGLVAGIGRSACVIFHINTLVPCKPSGWCIGG